MIVFQTIDCQCHEVRVLVRFSSIDLFNRLDFYIIINNWSCVDCWKCDIWKSALFSRTISFRKVFATCQSDFCLIFYPNPNVFSRWNAFICCLLLSILTRSSFVYCIYYWCFCYMFNQSSAACDWILMFLQNYRIMKCNKI